MSIQPNYFNYTNKRNINVSFEGNKLTAAGKKLGTTVLETVPAGYSAMTLLQHCQNTVFQNSFLHTHIISNAVKVSDVLAATAFGVGAYASKKLFKIFRG